MQIFGVNGPPYEAAVGYPVIEIVNQYHTLEWRASIVGSRTYDRLFGNLGSFYNENHQTSAANRLSWEDVGVPVFDY